MANWLRDFAAGMQIGESFMDNVREGQLRRGLSDLSKQKLEEVYAEAPADPNTEQSKMLAAQNEGLTNELPATRQVTGYKYGDRTFQYKPPAEYVDALKAKQRATLFEEYGDIDKAQVYRESATKQLADSYKTIAETAFAKGTPEAIVSAYSLINDGFDAKLEKNPDGTLRVLLYPEGQPDKTEEIFSGDSASVVDWAMKNTNPELYLKFADAATMRDYRKSLLEDRQLAREDRATAAQDRARQQEDQLGLRRIEALKRRVDTLAPGTEDHARALQEYDQAVDQWGGLRAPQGNPQGLGPAQGLSQNVVQWRPVVEDATRNLRYVTPDLAMSVIQQESKGNATAVSPAGAVGLMQLMPGTARDLGVSNPYDPVANIRGGVRYLDDLIARYDGDVQKGLMAYNWGMGNVDKHLAGQITDVPRETQNYVPSVMSRFGGAQAQGLTPAAPAAVDPRYVEMSKAMKDRMRPGTSLSQAPMSVNDWKVFGEMADGLLENDTAYQKLTSANDRLLARNKKVQELYNNYLQTSGLGGGGAGWDANTSMGQLANGQAPGATGTPEGNGGGLTGQDFSAFATATAAAAREEESKAASAKDQARFDHMVSTWAAGYKQQWFRDMKTSNPAYALGEARKAIAQIETLYPSLSAKGKKSAELALRGFWKTFPELMPKAAN